jgi:hypothetical protein
MSDRIAFFASLPPIQSAITLDGNGDGARIKLDIPASDVGAALLLQHHGAGQLLRVTIEVVNKSEDDKRKEHKQTYY